MEFEIIVMFKYSHSLLSLDFIKMIIDSTFTIKVAVIEFIVIIITATISRAFVPTIKDLGN